MADASEAYEQHWYNIMKHRPSEDAAIEEPDAVPDILGASDVIALIECLDDPDDPVRVRVIVTLGELGDRRAVPALRRIAGHDPDPEIVILAKQALAHLDAP
jgi:HEAT repeat protein